MHFRTLLMIQEISNCKLRFISYLLIYDIINTYISMAIVRGMPNKCWLYASLVIAKVGIVHEIHQKQITECMKGCGLQARGPFHTHCMVLALLIMEEFTVSVKCRTAIKALSMYLNLWQTMQWPKEKWQRNTQRPTKHYT
jgi:hypothetical protein